MVAVPGARTCRASPRWPRLRACPLNFHRRHRQRQRHRRQPRPQQRKPLLVPSTLTRHGYRCLLRLRPTILPPWSQNSDLSASSWSMQEERYVSNVSIENYMNHYKLVMLVIWKPSTACDQPLPSVLIGTLGVIWMHFERKNEQIA